ncbi:phage head spike fiber domain-containing protein [Escherichia coli]
MITGFSPSYKKIVIGDDEITMPGDKIVKFKRASTATYINKSGQLKLAEVDEPRFERDGLLIEGQRTNYLRNSNKPDSWTVHSALNKTFGTDKQGFNYATVTPTESIVGTTGGYTVHGVVAADRFPLASGECFTFSCRVKGAKARCRLRVSVIIGGTDTFSADSYLDLDTRIATVSGNTSLITAKAEQQGEWTYYEATYTANTDIDTVNCAFYMTNKISNETFYDDSTLTMTTPQIELGNTASSFIVTTMPTTRASDVVTIPSQNNLSTRPFTVLCEVSRNWSTPPNEPPRVSWRVFYL